MRVARYRAGDQRYLAVDAEQYVPDRTVFAARHCDPVTGVAPPAGQRPGQVHVEQGVSGPRGGPGVATDGGPAGPDRRVGADGVLFLALEDAFRPPRVVMTLVHPDGERTPCCTEGVRCAARWAAAQADTDRVMVDTQDGTRAARVHADGAVSVEVGDGPAGEVPMERGAVVREFECDLPEARG